MLLLSNPPPLSKPYKKQITYVLWKGAINYQHNGVNVGLYYERAMSVHKRTKGQVIKLDA